MEQVIAGKLMARKVALQLIGAFAALTLLLSALGLYGFLAYTVLQRRLLVPVEAVVTWVQNEWPAIERSRDEYEKKYERDTRD